LALSALINDNSSNVFVNQIADFKIVLLNNSESLTRLSFTLSILIAIIIVLLYDHLFIIINIL